MQYGFVDFKSLLPAKQVGGPGRQGDAAPSLPLHYEGFVATTSGSVPCSGIGILPRGFNLLSFQHIKANRGAAGIDDESIAMFEQDLSRNLYKLWNRMSSGSYFPPPVKQVEIPKATGGTRMLGVPTVAS